MQIADDILVKQIKNGDKNAFESIFKHYYSHLCAYANKFVQDIDESEEIVQEVFFQIWQKRENLDIKSAFKSYLFRAVRNSCLNNIKHKNIQIKHQDYTLHNNEGNQTEFEDKLETNELEERIRIAIDKLPTERKKIFLMIRFEELKYKEVAEKLSISTKTIENQMGKALKFMREELKDYLPVFILIAFETITNLFKN